MSTPSVKFKAYIDASIYDEKEDQQGMALTPLEHFGFGEVLENPVPAAPFLPTSKMHIKSFIRHRRLWLSKDEGSDNLWDKSMMPWLEAAMPRLAATVDKTNRLRAKRNRPPLEFGYIDIEIPPYTFSFPAQENVGPIVPAAQIDAFRALINSDSLLGGCRERIKEVEMPWERPEEIEARHALYLQAKEDEERHAALMELVAGADKDEHGLPVVYSEDGQRIWIDAEGNLVEDPATAHADSTETSLDVAKDSATTQDGAYVTSDEQVGSAETPETSICAETGMAETSFVSAMPAAPAVPIATPDAACDENESGNEDSEHESTRYDLWKITFVDGTSKVYNTVFDEWLSDECANTLPRIVDEDAMTALHDKWKRAEQAAVPLKYSQKKVHEVVVSYAEHDETWAKQRYDSFAEKRSELDALLVSMGSMVIGVSGGFNSVVLTMEAQRLLGNRAIAVFCDDSTFISEDRRAMVAAAERKGLSVCHMEHPGFRQQEVLKNNYLRCYHCRHALYATLQELASSYELEYIVQGQNYDLAHGIARERRAAKEFDVRSPLAEVGITREEALAWAYMLGLPMHLHDESCAATRFQDDQPLDAAQIGALMSLERSMRETYGLASLELLPENGNILRVSIDDNELHQMMGIDSSRRIDYRAITKLGREWIDPEPAKSELTSEKSIANQKNADRTFPNAKKSLNEASPSKAPVGEIPMSKKDAPMEEALDDTSDEAAIETQKFVGSVFRQLFKELETAGFDTVLVEDDVEHNRRTQEYRKWWIGLAEPVNSWGRC